LLARCIDVHADLLVMGAYGHSRLREWVLGGATRHVLQHAQLPLLLRH
jgi:nucleotide-binding universal stress UspA family protein